MRSLEKLWSTAGCPAESLQRIDIDGSGPVLPSPFKIAEAAAATVGATALAAAELWRLRSGRAQQVHVDTRTAAMAFRSERHLRIDGAPPPGLWDDIAGFHATGIAWECGHGGRPGTLPAQAQDHASGYLAAFGALVALARRATRGGSYLVRISLAQTGHWLRGLGRIRETGLAEPDNGDIADLLAVTQTPFGLVEHVTPAVADMSETPMRWTTPPVALGTHDPRWT